MLWAQYWVTLGYTENFIIPLLMMLDLINDKVTVWLFCKAHISCTWFWTWLSASYKSQVCLLMWQLLFWATYFALSSPLPLRRANNVSCFLDILTRQGKYIWTKSLRVHEAFQWPCGFFVVRVPQWTLRWLWLSLSHTSYLLSLHFYFGKMHITIFKCTI